MNPLNQKLDVPINWNKVLIYSASGMAALFILGLLAHLRYLIAMSEGIAVLVLSGLLIAAFIAIVKKFSA